MNVSLWKMVTIKATWILSGLLMWGWWGKRQKERREKTLMSQHSAKNNECCYNFIAPIPDLLREEKGSKNSISSAWWVPLPLCKIKRSNSPSPVQLIIRISRVSGETRCAKMHRSAGVSNEEKAIRVFFLRGPHANAIPVLVAKDEDN